MVLSVKVTAAARSINLEACTAFLVFCQKSRGSFLTMPVLAAQAY